MAIAVCVGLLSSEGLGFTEDLAARAAKDLESFRKHPRAFMTKLPKKKRLSSWQSRFSLKDRESGRFVELKHQWREQEICTPQSNPECLPSLSVSILAPTLSNDRPESLLDTLGEGMLRNLDDLFIPELMEARLDRESQPWSDHYWPIYQGGIGARYAPEEHWQLDTWRDYFDFVLSPEQLFSKLWAQILETYSPGNREVEQLIWNLSPAEKFDLLIGLSRYGLREEYTWRNQGRRFGGWPDGEDRDVEHPEGFLYPHQWLEGLRFYNASKDDEGKDPKVETWMGLCHGWAAAAYNTPRPEGYVDVPAADDPRVKIRFFPSDLKALNSYLWAERGVTTHFVGGRCDAQSPELDVETGRVVDPDCFDSNPHTWHLAIVNQLGVGKRSFVMDATFDYEVWNQPVVGYKFLYFDPLTFETSQDWRSVVRARTDTSFTSRDHFRRFRIQKVWVPDGRSSRWEEQGDYYDQVVGVTMEVEYLLENTPSHKVQDGPEDDVTTTVIYHYDLELNGEGEPVGGEWYQNAHPDFLWNIPPHVVATKEYHTPEDKELEGEWNPWDEPLPEAWRDKAKKASIQRKVPLGRIVDALVLASRLSRTAITE